MKKIMHNYKDPDPHKYSREYDTVSLTIADPDPN